MLDQIIAFLGQLPVYASAFSGVLVALIAMFMLIPGEQPEKAMQAVVDFIAKFSKK